MTTIDDLSVPSGEINPAGAALTTPEIKFRIALMFGDPVTEELAASIG